MGKNDGWWRTRPLVSELRPLFGGRIPNIPLLACCWCAGAALALLLGYLADANVLTVKATATLPLLSAPGTVPLTVQASETGGYLAEYTHGLYYLCAVPFFFLFAACCLRRYHRCLKNAIRTRVLLPETGAGPVFAPPSDRNVNPEQVQLFMENLGKWNFKSFRYIPVGLFALMLLHNGYREVSQLYSSDMRAGGIGCFGYMQAPYFGKWTGNFNDKAMLDRLDKISVLPTLSADMQKGILKKLRSKKDWAKDWVEQGLLLNDGKLMEYNEGEISEAIKDHLLSLDLKAAVAKKRLVLAAETFPATTGGHPFWFGCFFVAVILLESSFHTLCLWFAFKLIEWLWVVRRLLPRQRFLDWSLQPSYEDDEHQFGFKELQGTYNTLLHAVIVGILTILVHKRNNRADSGAHFWTSFDSVDLLIILSTLMVGVVLTLLAGFLNRDRMRHGQMEAIAHKLHQLAMCPDDDCREKRRDELEEIKAQRTWPKGDKEFWITLASAFVCLAMPLLPEKAVPDPVAKILEVSKWADIADYWMKSVDWITKKAYPGRQ